MAKTTKKATVRFTINFFDQTITGTKVSFGQFIKGHINVYVFCDSP